MGRRVVVFAVIVLVLLGGACVLVAATHKSKNTDGSTTSSTSNANSVTIKDFAFSPAVLTVKKGTTVTWTNQDAATHTVTSIGEQTGLNSATLNTGDTYSYTFDTAGTYNYECSLHPAMNGTIVVTD